MRDWGRVWVGIVCNFDKKHPFKLPLIPVGKSTPVESPAHPEELFSIKGEARQTFWAGQFEEAPVGCLKWSEVVLAEEAF